MNTTREEHIAWCKQRALVYVDKGDLSQAFASMMNDLSEHPETEKHGAIELGALMLFSGFLSTPHKMREFIEGFR